MAKGLKTTAIPYDREVRKCIDCFKTYYHLYKFWYKSTPTYNP